MIKVFILCILYTLKYLFKIPHFNVISYLFQLNVYMEILHFMHVFNSELYMKDRQKYKGKDNTKRHSYVG